MAKAKNLASEPVTALFAWTIKEGKEPEFERLMHEIHKVARNFPGHMGVTTLKSPANKDSVQTILRFDSPKHLEAWLSSPIRKKMMKSLEEAVHTDLLTKATGLETWFDIPGQLVIPPPKWKMVITTFIAIYPLSLLFSLLIAVHVESWPVVIRAMFLPIIAPTILTYLFMPFLTRRILKHWLYKVST